MSRESTDKVLSLDAFEQREYAAQPHRSPCKSIQCVTCHPTMGEAYNAARKLPAASSPAAGRNSEGAVRKGSQAAPSGPTGAGATPGVPDREAGASPFAPGNDDGEILGGTPRYPSSSPLGSAPTQTPASPTVPQGGAGPDERGAESARALGHEAGNETSGQPSAMQADTSPRWAPVDSGTGDLLDLLAIDDSLRADDWPFFLGVLKEAAAKNGGVIDQNHTRPRLHGEIRPARIGALYRRACREDLIRPNEGYTKTANSQSGNVGRPAKTYTWLGATA